VRAEAAVASKCELSLGKPAQKNAQHLLHPLVIVFVSGILLDGTAVIGNIITRCRFR
jgi:hypothetical protein